MYDIADLWTPRFMKSRGLSNRNWLSDPQDECHAGEAGCCRMMLASAVLGKSMLGGGLLSRFSRFHGFHPADMPFRSIPRKLLEGTLNGRRSESNMKHIKHILVFSQMATTGPSAPIMVSIAP